MQDTMLLSLGIIFGGHFVPIHLCHYFSAISFSLLIITTSNPSVIVLRVVIVSAVHEKEPNKKGIVLWRTPYHNTVTIDVQNI